LYRAECIFFSEHKIHIKMSINKDRRELDEEIEGNIINSANTLNDSISATKALSEEAGGDIY